MATVSHVKTGSELRTSTRFQVGGVATPMVYEHGFLASIGIGRFNQARAAVNLSEGGVLVRTHDRMKSGTKVKVRLEIEKLNDIIETEGVVSWCFQCAKQETNFYAGIRFTNMPPPLASKIAKLRGYFTSPEYRNKTAHQRRRQETLGFEFGS
jgi:Tfp pilus assembly protein PilZ